VHNSRDDPPEVLRQPLPDSRLSHGPPRIDGVHVLVVEDTDDSRDMLRVALEYCGALVMTAASVEEALQILGTLRPHVLVIDISMPDDAACLQLVRVSLRWAVAEVMPEPDPLGYRVLRAAVSTDENR
jgi:CheY-like chemotaxis protein